MLEEKIEKRKEEYKGMIVKFCEDNKYTIYRQFFTEEELKNPAMKEDIESFDRYFPNTLDPKNWEAEYMPNEIGEGINLWFFNCEPFDDQLRGYIHEKDGKVVHIEVVGE